MKQHVHFLGVCGTAMGAVAAAMARKGYVVTGSDAKVYPPMSDFLQAEKIKTFEGYSPDNIPADADIIVVGNAMSRGNEEVEAVLDRRLRYLSLPETMKEYFLRNHRNYVVTGTHGKTTTTSMLAWLMEYAQLNPSFMIGGIACNLKRGGRFTDSEFCVLEGDEYDTAFFDKRSKFLHYLPELVIMNNIEFDHADIYNSIDEIKLSFQRLLRVVPRSGLALINADDANCLDVTHESPCPVKTLGFAHNADIRIENVDYTPDGGDFTLEGVRYHVPMVGEFNVRNAAMAISAARFAGIPAETLVEGMKQFEGVARRQETRGTVNEIAVIDDFAHHPTAIQQSIMGLKQKFPGARIWGIFEPRSNTTRRNIFQDELAEALATADISIVAQPDDKEILGEKLNISQLQRDITTRGGKALIGTSASEIANLIGKDARQGDVVLVMSNGGFDGIHRKILDALTENQ
ncbi:MAG: UDP-N-acetylmuramate:L-alanyl-gamma-D-glutamyl-meso-diaminopimelate ligase [Akkermansia sp.]